MRAGSPRLRKEVSSVGKQRKQKERVLSIRRLFGEKLFGKVVLLRVDFNVPLQGKTVTDDERIRGALRTIRHLIKHHAKVVIISHLGKPKGTGYEEKFSLRPAADVLSELLGQEVVLVGGTVGSRAKKAVAEMSPGDVIMLENLRFDPREKSKDEAPRISFARKLAALADIFVEEAYGATHRKHASIVNLPLLLPAYAGFLVEHEEKMLTRTLKDPKKPFMAILGGAKVEDKFGLIWSLLHKANVLALGSSSAIPFLIALGYRTGKTLVGEGLVDKAAEYLAYAKENDVEILLPVDVVTASDINSTETNVYKVGEIPDDVAILDIGPTTRKLYAKRIAGARTVFWNGPMGVFEKRQFSWGTRAVAKAVAKSTGITVIGGGDSAAAIKQFGLAEFITHMSTGGGATLALLETWTLPGIEALRRRQKTPEIWRLPGLPPEEVLRY